ncbi:unnamed protein product, partial [Ectocarpus sp. 12 AP-2014]
GNGGEGGANSTFGRDDDTSGAGGAGGHAGAATLSLNEGGTGIKATSFLIGATGLVESTGGRGGNGGAMKSFASDVEAGKGGTGGDGGTADLHLDGGTYIQRGQGLVFQVWSRGGFGGTGGHASSNLQSTFYGGVGGDGGAGGKVTAALNDGTIYAETDAPGAILLESIGGNGGTGGSVSNPLGGSEGNAGRGGTGGDGGEIEMTSSGGSLVIENRSGVEGSHGVHLSSVAGQGGTGGKAVGGTSQDMQGGDGGAGGAGGFVHGGLIATISTVAKQGQGVWLRSYGGAGGDGGTADGGAGDGFGGAGAGSGPAGDVTLAFSGKITTKGEEANGILAQSVGGFSGDAGYASGFHAYGAGSESAGDGGEVSAKLDDGVEISTKGDHADAVLAQSIGGGGGRGSSTDAFISVGGSGSAGGDGGTTIITVNPGATLSTSGQGSRVLSASSVGGGGGDAGATKGAISLGAASGGGGDGGTVEVTNASDLTSTGDQSDGLFANSVGGGGGSAHSTSYGAIWSIGGAGGEGGDGGQVSVDSSGSIATTGDDSDGIYLSSVGGGGGGGTAALSTSVGFSMALAGGGGAAGAGNSVTFDDGGATGYSVQTTGDRARGLMALSVGGGGGDGGSATSISAGPKIAVAIGKSGSGSGGGSGGAVNVTSGGDFTTAGDNAPSIHAQSTGGAGGNAGTAIASANSTGIAIGYAMGGSGGTGGDGESVTVEANGNLATSGDNSGALIAHSTGGGGGHGGTTASGNAIAEFSFSAAIGGSGGKGGTGGDVTVTGGNVNTALTATTSGSNAPGVYAHSVGGGGGYSGVTAAATALSEVSVDVAMGGQGGDGGDSGAVSVDIWRDITTKGDISSGVTAQSVGGGGGHSGATAAGSLASQITTNLSVGGSGGGGGSAGTVGVSSNGAINTEGHSSSAISAYSTGGGGGASHFTGAFTGVAASGSMNTAIGGSGGVAGKGADVTVDATGDLSTVGHNAMGIVAMSTGGGGGDSGSTVTGTLVSKVSLGLSVGGDGGASGEGGDVTVDTSSNITTSGDLSLGIHAKSIASSGGNAGLVAAGSGLSYGNINIAVGGDGGAGGQSGDVTVASGGFINTSGSYATGISAQSLAGGGGSAKGSVTGSALSMGILGVTIGGAGGKGGVSGDVNVTSYAGVSTKGFTAYGIHAQSHGGTGGDGGLAAQGSLTAGEVSGELAVNVGGDGGDSGKSGDVSVTTTSSVYQINTADYGSKGIYATSIGGNGGTGGSVYSGNLSFSSEGSAKVNVNVGGGGGGGATAGDVTVSNANQILTDGYFSDAITAQSIGGNGGNGGSTYSVVGGISASSSATVSIDVGGGGGTGAVAGVAKIVNTGDLTTAKGGSYGAFAQSLGGGGGTGGSAANLNLTLKKGSSATSDGANVKASLNIAVGGHGGSGNDGNAATITNSGAVTTAGVAADGLFAQSVGGGGGDGGAASSTSINLQEMACNLAGIATARRYTCKSKDAGEGEKETNVELAANVVIGGGGGDGGEAEINNTGAVTTSGDASYGIHAQSIGGGGGVGGKGGLGLEAWTDNETALSIEKTLGTITETPSWTSLSVAVGGSSGATGSGGEVNITNGGLVTTSGAQAHGIYAQSVGAAGGEGGAAVGGLWTVATIGGGAGATGDGGDVDVTLDATGGVTTTGNGSIGVFAQSVGGGGGAAGDVEKGIAYKFFDLNIGVGLGIQLDNGNSGDGGDITVSTAAGADIQTSGELAHGMMLHSVGGGGGVAGIDGALADVLSNNFVGSTGGAGDGGNVKATIGSEVTVSGKSATGIFAQSTSGSGTDDASGTVEIEVIEGGSVKATGLDARAILAQSQNGDGINNRIAITIAEGAEVSTGAESEFTIGLKDGRDNTIVNSGTLSQYGDMGAVGHVVRTDGMGALTITNNGMLAGVILSELGPKVSGTAQAITVSNTESGIYDLGHETELAGGTITNAGSMSASRHGVVAQIAVNGAITQTETGTTQVDIAYGRENDLIHVTAADTTSIFAGKILPVIISGIPKSGDASQYRIIESDGDLVSKDLQVKSTATIDYSLSTGTIAEGRNVVLMDFKVDYTPWRGDAVARAKVSSDNLAVLNDNHDSIGDHVNDLFSTVEDTSNAALTSSAALQGAAVTGTIDRDFVKDLAVTLLSAGTVDDLIDMYDDYAPSEIFAPTDSARFSSLRFSDDLISCPAATEEGDTQVSKQGTCYWGRLGGSAIDRQRDGMSMAYDESILGISGGGQIEIADDWFVGAALSYEKSNLSSDGFSGDADRFQLGVAIKREIGATAISGSLSGGGSSYDLARQVVTADGTFTALSDPKTTWIAGHARIAHLFNISKSTYLRPLVDLGVQHTRQGEYTETGAGNFGLNVGAMSDTFVTINPKLEIGRDFRSNGTAAHANFSIGALAVLGGAEQSADVRFIGVGDTGPGFTIAGNGDDLFADLSAELEVPVSDRTTVRAGFGALLSDNQQQYSASLKVSFKF